MANQCLTPPLASAQEKTTREQKENKNDEKKKNCRESKSYFSALASNKQFNFVAKPIFSFFTFILALFVVLPSIRSTLGRQPIKFAYLKSTTMTTPTNENVNEKNFSILIAIHPKLSSAFVRRCRRQISCIFS